MSTLIGDKFFSTKNVLCSKHFSVQKETLGDAVKRLREGKGFSLEDVRRKSRKQLATSYISRIENNQIMADVISIGKLQALAKGLEVPEVLLFDLARGVKPAASVIGEIAMYLEGLTPARQEDVLAITKLFYGQDSAVPSKPPLQTLRIGDKSKLKRVTVEEAVDRDTAGRKGG